MNQRGNCAQSLGYLAHTTASVNAHSLFRNGEVLGYADHGMPVIVRSIRAFNMREDMTGSDGRNAVVSIVELCGTHDDLNRGR